MNIVSVEHMLTLLIITRIFISCLYSIRYSLPLFWTSDHKTHLGLKSWLIEAWKDSEAVEGFKLGHKILQFIFAICERV